MNRAVLRQPYCRPGIVRSIYSPGVSLPRTFSVQSIYNSNERTWARWSRWEKKPVPKSTRPVDPLAGPIDPNHVPWYLQGEEQHLFEEEPEISPRHDLPDLPEDPPYLLPRLLQYSAQDIGLENMKLLDLRPLETPSALGANVIMIVGTARSVKHLNTAADRLCRWLRGFWELHPHADGLLGRGELILKIRRMVRRAKIARRHGREPEEGESDQHPGWICVNVGDVEESPVVKRMMAQEAEESITEVGGTPAVKESSAPKSKAPKPRGRKSVAEGFEGFGDPVIGTRVVIQMFTEEKRAEVDLETLWEKRLDRALREKESAETRRPEPELKKKHPRVPSTAPPQEVRSSTSTILSPSASDHRHGLPTRTPVNTTLNKRREIHSGHPRIMSRAIHNAANTSVSSPFRSSIDGHERSPADILDFLLHYLTDMSNSRAKKDLGEGPDDTSSTPFLKLFHEHLSHLSGEEEAFAKLKLHCVALHQRHPGYSKQELVKAFEYYSALAIPISDDLSHEIVSALLVSRPAEESDQEGKETLPAEDIELAMKVLAHLSTQGTNIINLKMFNIIYKAAMAIPDRIPPESEPSKHPDDAKMNSALYRVSRMIDAFDFPFDAEQTRLHMILRFRAKDYDGFWKIWRKLPLMDYSRTAADYEMLFMLHRDLGDAQRSEECLTTWLPMLAREEPPILLEGTLLSTVFQCIYNIDPDVKTNVQNGVKNNITTIWIKCQRKRALELKRQSRAENRENPIGEGMMHT